jgi:cell division septation protein DedD
MPFVQLDPVPDLISLTVRVDSLANPDLAAHIWGLAWGAKNSAVVELLNLGLAAQLGGAPPAIVRSAIAPPAQKRRRKTAARSRQAASVASAPVPAQPAVEVQPIAPPSQAAAPTTTSPPPTEPTDPDSGDTGISPFLSQFL